MPKGFFGIGDKKDTMHEMIQTLSWVHRVVADIDHQNVFLLATVIFFSLISYGYMDEVVSIGGVIAIISRHPYILTSNEFFTEWIQRQLKFGLHGTLAFYVKTISIVFGLASVLLFIWMFGISLLTNLVLSMFMFLWQYFKMIAATACAIIIALCIVPVDSR